MNRRYFVACGILAASIFAGCGDKPSPNLPKSNPASATTSTTHIRIDGFKKSKSGAT